jgi:hypothetical protein
VTLRSSCIHEAAHAVVALSLGFSVDGVEAGADGFKTLVDGPCDPTPHEAFSLAVVAMASMPAVRKDGHPMDHCFVDDFDNACLWLKHWYGEVVRGEELLALVDHAERLATDIVERRWSDIERVAELLQANTGTASSEEILTVLRDGMAKS